MKQKTRSPLCRAVILLAAILAAQAARAVPLGVVNAGFESPALGEGGVNTGAVPGWVKGGTGSVGNFNAGPPWYGAAVPAGLEGNLSGFFYMPDPAQSGVIYQDLASNYVAGRTYALTIAFGLRSDGETLHGGSVFGFYTTGGVALGTRAIVAAELAANGYRDLTINYTATGTEGAIRVGIVSDGNGGSFVDFDDVRLDDGTPPPPGVSGITAPRARQVVQRGADNRADVAVAGAISGAVARLEARAVLMAGAGQAGPGTDWQLLAQDPVPGTFTATLHAVPAGGWYRVETRALDTAGALLGTVAGVDRVGVGEVFITAGQSNSVCFGAPPQIVADDRVSTLALGANSWALANDPQPDNSGFTGSGGSPWPRFGSRLVAAWNVPVGLVCVGYGGASVAQFLPAANQFYPALRTAVQRFPAAGFRAVLWHQGESDAINNTSAALYASQLQTVITQSRADAGWAAPWGVAQAAFHPGASYAGQETVNAGERVVCFTTAGVFRGARTDDFHLEEKLSDTVHFNATGLTEHGDRWADLVLGPGQPVVKNGNLEAGAALADGATRTGQIIGFNAFNSAGDAATDAGVGTHNPAPILYASASDAGPNGGVLPGMAGGQMAFLYGGSAGASFVQQLPATLRAGTRYELRVALGVRTSGDVFGEYAIALLARGTVLAEITGTRATLDALESGNAADRFTDVMLTYDSPGTVAPEQALDIRIRRMAGGATAYLDFDNVRLTTTPRTFATWQTEHFGSPANSAAAAGMDNDRDGLVNLLEFALDRAPTVPDIAPALLDLRADGSLFAQRRRAAPGLTFRLEFSSDLTSWNPAVGVIEQIYPLGGDFEAATYLPPATGAARIFYHLRVTLAE